MYGMYVCSAGGLCSPASLSLLYVVFKMCVYVDDSCRSTNGLRTRQHQTRRNNETDITTMMYNVCMCVVLVYLLYKLKSNSQKKAKTATRSDWQTDNKAMRLQKKRDDIKKPQTAKQKQLNRRAATKH